MKKLFQNIRTWPCSHDLMTDMFYIEEDRHHDDEISERGAISLIVLSALAVWAITICILLP